jgi:tetratricopeptide (TPR) repeat protein
MLKGRDKERWESIGRFEMNLRRLIADVLTEKFGAHAWDEGIPKGTRDRIAGRIKEHQGRSMEDVVDLEDRMMECDMGGLFEIIDKNWRDAFSRYFPGQHNMWDLQSSTIKNMRDCLDHYRKQMMGDGSEEKTLRPTFDMIMPTVLKNLFKAIAERGLFCVDVQPESAEIFDREIPLSLRQRDYTHFVGRINEIKQIIDFLSDDRVCLIVVHGIGGVGKTATCIESGTRAFKAGLFDEVVYAPVKRGFLLPEQAACAPSQFETYQDFLCLLITSLGGSVDNGSKLCDIEQQSIKTLQNQKTLIIVDNFETLQGQEEISEFFWRVPIGTKIMVTSRVPPSSGGRLYHLGELTKEDIREIIRNECCFKGKPTLINVDSEEIINSIYETIGGVPLAAKLLVGMMVHGMNSLETILSSFQFADRNRLPDFCFTRIYNEMLDDNSKLLLKAFGIIGSNASASDLQATTELFKNGFSDAMAKLEMTGLVTRIRGTEHQDSFSILPLTRFFAKQKLLETPGLETVFTQRMQTYEDHRNKISDESTASKQKARALANFANIKLQQNRLDDALQLIKDAISTDDDLAFIYIVYGKIEERRLNYTEAEMILNEGHKRFPEDATITHKLAMIESLLSKYEIADALYRSILIVAPINESEILQDEYAITGMADNYLRWTHKLRDLGRYNDSKKKLDEIMTFIEKELKWPGAFPYDISRLICRIRQQIGISLTISKNFEEAENCLMNAFIDNVQRFEDVQHNHNIFNNLEHNIQKWKPNDKDERRRQYKHRLEIIRKADIRI